MPLDARNFLEDVRAEFDFLVSDYGFQIEKPEVDLVRCSNETTVVLIRFAGRQEWLGLSIVRLEDESGRHEDCGIDSVVRCVTGEPYQLHREPFRRTMRGLLRKLASELRQYGDPFLRGDQTAFRELYARRNWERKIYTKACGPGSTAADREAVDKILYRRPPPSVWGRLKNLLK